MLILALVLCATLAVYMAWADQREFEQAAKNAAEGHNYEEVQNMVILPSPEAEVFVAPYDTEQMLDINKDFKGWLWIPDTLVNYPVVKGTDNDTYLRRTFLGEYSVYGTPFIDKRSHDTARNTVIHGHNMGAGRTEMFSCLTGYLNQEWAREREYAYYTEPEDMQDNEYRLFAVLNFNINYLEQFNYFQADFETEDDFRAFADYLISRSLYETEFYPQRDILILSTCNRSAGGDDNRLLICFGRGEEQGEPAS